MTTRLQDPTSLIDPGQTPGVEEEPSFGIGDVISQRLEEEGAGGVARLAMPTTMLEYSPTVAGIEETARTDGTMAAGLQAIGSAPTAIFDAAESLLYYSGLGDGIDMLAGIFGRDPVTGIKMDTATRWLSFAPFFIGGAGLTVGFHRNLSQLLRADEAAGIVPGSRALISLDAGLRVRVGDVVDLPDSPYKGKLPSHPEYHLRADAFSKGRSGILHAATAGDAGKVAQELISSRRIETATLDNLDAQAKFVTGLGEALMRDDIGTAAHQMAKKEYASPEEAAVRIAGAELYRVDRMVKDGILGDGFDEMIGDYDSMLAGTLDSEGTTRLTDSMVDFIDFVGNVTDIDGDLPPMLRWHQVRRVDGEYFADMVAWLTPVKVTEIAGNPAIDWNSLVPYMVQQALDLYDARFDIASKWDTAATKAAEAKGEVPKYNATQRVIDSPHWYTFVKRVMMEANRTGANPEITLAAIMTAVGHMSNQAPWDGPGGSQSVAVSLLQGATSFDEIRALSGANPAMFQSHVQRAIDVLRKVDIDPYGADPLSHMTQSMLKLAEKIRTEGADSVTSFGTITGEKIRSFVWNLMRGDSLNDYAVTVDRHIANLLMGFYPLLGDAPSGAALWSDNAYSAMAAAIRIAAMERGFDMTDLDKTFRAFQAAVWIPWKHVDPSSLEGPKRGFVYDRRILDVIDGRFDQPWHQWLLDVADQGHVFDPVSIGKVKGLKKGSEAVLSVGSNGTWRLFAPDTDEYAMNFRHLHATDHEVGEGLVAWAPAGPTVVERVGDELDLILKANTAEGKPGGSGASIYPGGQGLGPKSLPQYQGRRSIRVSGMKEIDAVDAHERLRRLLDDQGVRYEYEILPESEGIGIAWKAPNADQQVRILEMFLAANPDANPETVRRTLAVLGGNDRIKTFDEEIAQQLAPLIDEHWSGQWGEWNPNERQARFLPRHEAKEAKVNMVIYPERAFDWDAIWRVLWSPWEAFHEGDTHAMPNWFGEHVLQPLLAEIGTEWSQHPRLMKKLVPEVADMYFWRELKGRFQESRIAEMSKSKSETTRQKAEDMQKTRDRLHAEAVAKAEKLAKENPFEFVRQLAIARYSDPTIKESNPGMRAGFRVLDMLYHEQVADISGYPKGQADLDAVDQMLMDAGWLVDEKLGTWQSRSTIPTQALWEMTVMDPTGSIMTHITPEGSATRPDVVRTIVNGEFAKYIKADDVQNQHVRTGPDPKVSSDGGIMFGTELVVPPDGAYGGMNLEMNNPSHALDVHLVDPETGASTRPDFFAMWIPDDTLTPNAVPSAPPKIVFDGDNVVQWFIERGMSPSQVLVGDLHWGKDGSLTGAELFSPSDLQVWRGKAILRRTGVPDKVVRKMIYEPDVPIGGI